jgi:type II pantothenate kinase
MLVSIGSGVSMIKVDPTTGAFERVSGTMIGGGTLMGLSNLLTGVNNFDEIIKYCEKGDNANVDMLVKDIYGD